LRRAQAASIPAALAALLLVSAGCSSPCRPNTLFVRLDSSGAPISAGDALHVVVKIDTGRTLTTDLMVQAGSGLELEFDPADYPAGHNVDLSVELHDGSGALIATGQATAVPLTASCGTAQLMLSPVGGEMDVSDDMSTDAPPDFAGVTNLVNGSQCNDPAECQSHFCVDGVCCDAGCTGQCEACDATGTCVAVTSGAPKGSRAPCAGTGTCAGTCSATSRTVCSYPGSVVSCRTRSCSGGVKTVAAGCDGAGNCPTAQTFNCPNSMCDGTDCQGACLADIDCQPTPSTPYCNLPQGVCMATKGIAASCTAGTDCTSTFCTDGVCCDARCTGQCQACNLTGNVGHCGTVTSGQPVTGPGTTRTACAGSGLCKGTCDGNSATMCKLPGNTVTCGSAACTNGSLTPAPLCNSAGSCVPGTATPCTSNQCQTTTACLPSCAVDGDCGSNRYCTGGKCFNKGAAGATCAGNNQCSSGVCGIAGSGNCCTAACTTGGMCGATACSSTGACVYPTNTTSCGSASCSNGQLTPAGKCNGAGACTPGTPGSCPGGFICASTTACKTSCASAGDCASQPSTCSGGACMSQGGPGAPCSNNSQCTSNLCGVAGTGNCCSASCTTGGTCGASGCNTSGACVYPSSSTRCGSSSCSGSTFTPAGSCNGSGSCTAGTPGACAGGFICVDSTSCKTLCGTDTDCASSNYCTSGSCVAKLANGTACGGDNQCLTGVCADGFCCDMTCSGACQACNLASSRGTCSSVLNTTGPRCNGTMTCDGAGNCLKTNGQACSTGSECLIGNCVGNLCCDGPCTGGCQSCTQSPGTCTTLPAGSTGSSCGLFLCQGGTDCPTTCTDISQCVPGTLYCGPMSMICENSTCFVAGTLVQTESGPRPIETIGPGVRVRSFDTQKGEDSYRVVLKLEQRIARSVVSLVLDGGPPIQVSPEHYFWVRGSGWVRAQELSTDDQLLIDRTRAARVTGLSTVATPSVGVPVYNLAVEGFDNYFVGTTPVLVHSCDSLGFSSFARDELPQ
jgi:hypothetical protein